MRCVCRCAVLRFSLHRSRRRHRSRRVNGLHYRLQITACSGRYTRLSSSSLLCSPLTLLSPVMCWLTGIKHVLGTCRLDSAGIDCCSLGAAVLQVTAGSTQRRTHCSMWPLGTCLSCSQEMWSKPFLRPCKSGLRSSANCKGCCSCYCSRSDLTRRCDCVRRLPLLFTSCIPSFDLSCSCII